MSSSLRVFVVVFLAWALVFVPGGQARHSDAGQGGAQSALTGLVKDAQGGGIPGATVVVKNTQTGISTTTQTNGTGNWAVPRLDPGTYSVTVSLTNFKTVSYDKINLTAGQATHINTVLEVGSVADVIRVTAQTQLVETSNSNVTTTVSADQMNALPQVTKNALQYVTYLPGVNTGTSHVQRSSTIVGLPPGGLAITLDGVNVMDQYLKDSSGSSFFAIIRPQTDLIEEVTVAEATAGGQMQLRVVARTGAAQTQNQGTAAYAPIIANPFHLVVDQPLSTFAADVDTASYTNVRRFLTQGQLPPADAVRIEELVNYFRFAYPEPAKGRPVSISTEIGPCPWAPTHKLALIGLRARPIDDRDVKGRNITLLIDVSGSMMPPERLPLIKTALRMFVDTLRDEDRVAIVVYAGASGLALPATPGTQRQRIHDAIENLQAGGSTNGADGLLLAYQVADQNFIKGGINRVILATDGDFNVGVTSQEGLMALIEREKQTGVFLSVLGVGTDNLQDRTMSMLADKGNGHYAYLDSIQAARRVLVQEGGATLETVAKDVKLQIEFNPAQVGAYRLLGYEKRLLAARDFNDDKKDGGEMGAGHTVTALYELVPADADIMKAFADEGAGRPEVDPLKYQPPLKTLPAPVPQTSREWLTVKVRYKLPDESTSALIEQPLTPGGAATHLSFAAAVAEFGMLLRDARPLSGRWEALVKRVKDIGGIDSVADRASFSELVETAASLKRLSRQ
jgi:Ca-activated chloride channel family protein